jgi:hypothetical protein
MCIHYINIKLDRTVYKFNVDFSLMINKINVKNRNISKSRVCQKW